jgi:hypothetical protein
VKLAYADLAGVLEYPHCFIIHHDSGFQVRVPRDRLTQSETSHLVALQNVHPKIARKMYR